VVFLPDINIWVSLATPGHAHHTACVDWLDSVATRASIRFCRTTQQGFLRLVTNRAIQNRYGGAPLNNDGAWNAYRQFAADDRVGPLLTEPDPLERVWYQLSSRTTASPQMWTDTYLAAFAIVAGATFVTIDRAFTQFDGLDLHLIE
jgi:toxin-antitoxin system PIN domain toxin